MEQNQNSQKAEIPASIDSVPQACPEMVQQMGTGAIAVTVIGSIILLIHALTGLVKAKP